MKKTKIIQIMKCKSVIALQLCAVMMFNTSCSQNLLDKDMLVYEEEEGSEDGSGGLVYTSNYDKEFVAPEGYKLVEALSDEFNGDELDTDKWEHNYGRGGWTGRGAKFTAENVSVQDGSLQLRPSLIGTTDQLKRLYEMIEEEFVNNTAAHYDEIDPLTWDPMTYGSEWLSDWGNIDSDNYQAIMDLGLQTIGAASVMSKAYGTKGIYEARIKASKFPISTAVWLQGASTEFDLTESCGGTSVEENSYTADFPYKIQTSVWVNAKDWEGVNYYDKGGVEHQSDLMTFPIWSEYFVLCLKWEEESLTVLVNDVELYSFSLVGNTTTKDGSTEYGSTAIGTPIPSEIFLEPQQLIFDTEMLWGPDHGWPTYTDLVDGRDGLEVYYVDWVRVWEVDESYEGSDDGDDE